MWNWVWINSVATSTVPGVFVFSLLYWIIQAVIAAVLSALYRRLKHHLFARSPSGRTAANLRTQSANVSEVVGNGDGRGERDGSQNANVLDEVIRNGGRQGGADVSQILSNRFKRQGNIGRTEVIHGESEQVCYDCQEDEGMVGLSDKTRDVLTKLQTTWSIGLYGMAGVGKTTLAKAVFENLRGSGHFDYTCFVLDTKDIVKKYSGKKLTSSLLSDLKKRQNLEVAKRDRDWSTLKGKNVLLVLDDVGDDWQWQDVPWKLKQQDGVCTSNWFGQESYLIVTSRDKSVCDSVCKDTFNVEELDDEDARQLFNYHAFVGSDRPSFWSGENNVVKEILDICGNIPLALEVVGKYLRNKATKRQWISTLQTLREGGPINGSLNNRLVTCLRLSYDELAMKEQSIFLDASILFMGDSLVKVMEIWAACWESEVDTSWENLIDKSLVKSVNGKVWVHEQFRILARRETCGKHKKIELWTRVASPSECKQIFQTQKGPNCAEGLIYVPRVTSSLMVLNRDAFSPGKFPELRVLKIRGIDVSGENMIFPPNLIFLSWSGAPYAKCPFRLKDLKRLSILELKDWNALEVLPNGLEYCTTLTRIQLKGCKKVKELPYGISNLNNLKFLGLKATGMEKLPDSLWKLGILETLELGETSTSELSIAVANLKNLRRLGLTKTPLSALPPSVCLLRRLTDLDLSGTSVSYLPDAVGELASLNVLNLSDTQLVTLPDSVGDIVCLETLIVGSTALISLPNTIGKLQHLMTLEISSAALQTLPASFGDMGNLHTLKLRCDALESLPESSGNLKHLRDLTIRDATIESLPKSFTQLKALSRLDVSFCESLSCLPEGFHQVLLREFLAFNCKRLELGEIVGGITVNDCLGLDNYGHTRWDTLSPIATGETSLPQMKLYPELRQVLILDRDNVQLFPEYLMNALHRLDKLECLTMQHFHALTSLPGDFGCLLSPLVYYLYLAGFDKLEELPSSMGNMRQLRDVTLIQFDKLKRLPVSLWKLPLLKSLTLRSCGSLQMQPSSHMKNLCFSAVPGKRDSLTITTDNWMFFLNVVECFGHISILHIKFLVDEESWLEIRERHPTARRVKSYAVEDQWVWTTEWLEGDEIVEYMKTMKVVYGDDTMIDAAESHVVDLQFKLILSEEYMFL